MKRDPTLAPIARQHFDGLLLARRIRAGMISVNGGASNGADIPFGGYKLSGIGRQNGVSGFEQYLETKAVAWPTA